MENPGHFWVEINSVVQADYEYNYLGQQVVRRLTQAGQTIHSVHDAAGQRVAEYLFDAAAGTSSLIREYIWANGTLVGVYENGQMYYVRTDHIGRPVFATDSTGVVVWEASYLPFGGIQASSGPNLGLRLSGQWFQSESGLHQNWMRDYDPTTGRYIQADPLGLVDGASVYGYALQNPGRYADFFGLLVDLFLRRDPSNPTNSLECTCGDEFNVFSGNGEHRNNGLSQSVPNDGPIPSGRYYIVDRPSGGRNPLRRIYNAYRGKNHWFGLFADDGQIDDYTELPNGQTRGNFRLHPGRLSLGCVTLSDEKEYAKLREILLNTSTAKIPGTNIRYYGVLTVD